MYIFTIIVLISITVAKILYLLSCTLILLLKGNWEFREYKEVDRQIWKRHVENIKNKKEKKIRSYK